MATPVKNVKFVLDSKRDMVVRIPVEADKTFGDALELLHLEYVKEAWDMKQVAMRGIITRDDRHEANPDICFTSPNISIKSGYREGDIVLVRVASTQRETKQEENKSIKQEDMAVIDMTVEDSDDEVPSDSRSYGSESAGRKRDEEDSNKSRASEEVKSEIQGRIERNATARAADGAEAQVRAGASESGITTKGQGRPPGVRQDAVERASVPQFPRNNESGVMQSTANTYSSTVANRPTPSPAPHSTVGGEMHPSSTQSPRHPAQAIGADAAAASQCPPTAQLPPPPYAMNPATDLSVAAWRQYSDPYHGQFVHQHPSRTPVPFILPPPGVPRGPAGPTGGYHYPQQSQQIPFNSLMPGSSAPPPAAGGLGPAGGDRPPTQPRFIQTREETTEEDTAAMDIAEDMWRFGDDDVPSDSRSHGWESAGRKRDEEGPNQSLTSEEDTSGEQGANERQARFDRSRARNGAASHAPDKAQVGAGASEAGTKAHRLGPPDTAQGETEAKENDAAGIAAEELDDQSPTDSLIDGSESERERGSNLSEPLEEVIPPKQRQTSRVHPRAQPGTANHGADNSEAQAGAGAPGVGAKKGGRGRPQDINNKALASHAKDGDDMDFYRPEKLGCSRPTDSESKPRPKMNRTGAGKEVVEEPRTKRRRGRPPGSKNKPKLASNREAQTSSRDTTASRAVKAKAASASTSNDTAPPVDPVPEAESESTNLISTTTGAEVTAGNCRRIRITMPRDTAADGAHSTPAADIGPGWTMVTVSRPDESCCVQYWCTPGGKKLWSLEEVDAYKNILKYCGNNEELAWQSFKGKGTRSVTPSPSSSAGGKKKAAAPTAAAPKRKAKETQDEPSEKAESAEAAIKQGKVSQPKGRKGKRPNTNYFTERDKRAGARDKRYKDEEKKYGPRTPRTSLPCCGQPGTILVESNRRVYFTEKDAETPTTIAANLGLEPECVVYHNRGLYRGLTVRAGLRKCAPIVLPLVDTNEKPPSSAPSLSLPENGRKGDNRPRVTESALVPRVPREPREDDVMQEDTVADASAVINYPTPSPMPSSTDGRETRPPSTQSLRHPAQAINAAAGAASQRPPSAQAPPPLYATNHTAAAAHLHPHHGQFVRPHRTTISPTFLPSSSPPLAAPGGTEPAKRGRRQPTPTNSIQTSPVRSRKQNMAYI